MELWVRSQDKEHLIKTTDIDLSCDDKSIILINNYEMAKYETKERALEVMDAIQTLIEEYYDCLDNKIVLAPVYQMPKE
jgi:hypothetical protein